MITIFGYWRCSTDAQDQERQIRALKDAGCEKIVGDKITGTSNYGDRDSLSKLLDDIKEGDLLILDEASQVNLAEIFPVLYRAKRFCIVGDHKQLGIKAAGGMFISKVYEKLTWEKYFSSLPKYPVSYKKAEERDLLVSRSSILTFSKSILFSSV